MKKGFYQFFGGGGIIIFLLFPLSAEEWKFVKNDDGIKVYSKDVENSKMTENMGVAAIDAPVEVIIEVLMDIPELLYWIPNCKVVKRMEEFKSQGIFSYWIFHTPVPFMSDREGIMRTDTIFDFENGIFRVNYEGVKEIMIPLSKKYVRLKKFYCRFTARRINSNKTMFALVVHGDPGVHIPSSILNRQNRAWPYKAIKGLRKMVKKDKFKEPKYLSAQQEKYLAECVKK